VGKLLHFPCDPDPEEAREAAEHNLEILTDAEGHPTEIRCSCGEVFNVSIVWGED
jgi:hypothetical protein